MPAHGSPDSASLAAMVRMVELPAGRECLEFAMEAGEMEGIWGGTTPEERVRARRKEADARRRARRNGQEVQAA